MAILLITKHEEIIKYKDASRHSPNKSKREPEELSGLVTS